MGKVSAGKPDRWASLRENRTGVTRPNRGKVSFQMKIPRIKSYCQAMYFVIINHDFVLIGVSVRAVNTAKIDRLLPRFFVSFVFFLE